MNKLWLGRPSHNGVYISTNHASPAGTKECSPPFQGWVRSQETTQVPQGRQILAILSRVAWAEGGGLGLIAPGGAQCRRGHDSMAFSDEQQT